MENLSTMETKTALEVACGECLVTRGILLEKFFEIDLMDQSEAAIEHAEKLQAENPCINMVHKKSMQKFETDSKYDCIVLRHCTGYLEDAELKEFLQKLGTMLKRSTDDFDGI